MGSRGPPLEILVEIPINEIRAAVSKSMRIFTRDGCPRLADVVGKQVEVWSGLRWFQAWVTVNPISAKLYRVGLDNGTSLVCSADHPWAVIIDGKIVPIKTYNLLTDYVISPFLLFTHEDLNGTPNPGAYEKGVVEGRRCTGWPGRYSERKDGIPANIFGMDRESFGLFAAGWIDVQRGVMIGCYAAIRDMYIAFHRFGINHMRIQNRRLAAPTTP